MRRLSKWAVTLFNFAKANRKDGVFCYTSVNDLCIEFQQEAKVIRKALTEIEQSGFADLTWIDKNKVRVYINEE